MMGMMLEMAMVVIAMMTIGTFMTAITKMIFYPSS